MQTLDKTLIDLETKFWQSIVDQDTEVAVSMLSEPALLVSPHGAMKFDHAGYRKMAEQGSMVLKSFELKDVEVVFPNDSTAILTYGVKQAMASRGKTGSVSQEMQEMADSSTWIQTGDGWRCVMHTETPIEQKDMTRH
jgi:hypothetical protein